VSPLATSTACASDAPELITAVFAWLDAEITTGRDAASVPVPLLGSPEWRALPEREPAKWAAVFVAARAWYADYTSIGEQVRADARELLELFEAYAAERDKAHYAPLREAAEQAAASIDRREREAARAESLPNCAGSELIAAAHASWGFPLPAEQQRTTLRKAA